jgi:hypothetical protein
MDDLGKLTEGLSIKIRQLALRYKTLSADHEALKLLNGEKDKSIAAYKQTIVELEKQIQILTIAKSIPSGKGTTPAKKKINELLREIDNCIDLLNQNPI